MPVHDQDDFSFAEHTALLVYRLMEDATDRARDQCFEWALQSPRHLLEILETLRTLHVLDGLARTNWSKRVRGLQGRCNGHVQRSLRSPASTRRRTPTASPRDEDSEDWH
jgi:hypothetical protein